MEGFNDCEDRQPTHQVPQTSTELLVPDAEDPPPTSHVQGEWDFPEIRGLFVILGKIGHGTFSCVYKAQSITTNQIVALKRIYSTSSPTRIDREIRIIHALGGTHFVGGILGCLRCHGDISLVLPYFEHNSFREVFMAMTLDDVKDYLRALFTALAHVHKSGFIHRDIKPSNFLYCKAKRDYMLVDFGLAEVSNYEQERRDKQLHLSESSVVRRASRAGTKGFRAPEVLMKIYQQSTAIDIWSAGVIFLSILSGRFPFFRAPDDMTALAEIGAIFGTQEIAAIGLLFKKKVQFPKQFPPLDLQSLCMRISYKKIVAPPEAYHLLSRCLDVNPNTRITAVEALAHPFITNCEQNGV